MRSFVLIAIVCLAAGLGMAQDSRFPRTVKLYPFNLFRGELSVGYEHGIVQRLSLTGQLSYMGTGSYSQVNGSSGRTGEECTYVWPTRGWGMRAGARYYPSKVKRSGPFYLEGQIAYRRLQFPEMTEYSGASCEVPATDPAKTIRPLVQRVGMQVLLGGALRRDRFFTIDLFGGLGLHALITDEQQAVDPGGTDSFYRIEPVRKRSSGSVHLGFSLGFNLHGMRKR